MSRKSQKYLIFENVRGQFSPKSNRMMSNKIYRPCINLNEMEWVVRDAAAEAIYAWNQSISLTSWRGDTIMPVS